MQMYNPSHPGAILEEIMGDAITISALAKHLGMTRANLSMILNGRLSVSAAVATKLGQAFPKWDAEFWLGLQNQYDLAQIRKRKQARIEPLKLAA